MKKALILPLVLLIFSQMQLIAQKDYVHLKNGTVMKGRIIYSNDPDKIVLKSSGSIFVFDREKVDTVTAHLPTHKTETLPRDFKCFFRAGVSILASNGSNEQPAPAGFQASFNHAVYKNSSAGIGAGMEFYKQVTFIPVFANIEYRLRNTRFSPIAFFKCGYLLASNETIQKSGPMPLYYDYYDPSMPNYSEQDLDPHGGVMINPGFGFNAMVSNNFGFYLGLGYRYHKIGFDGDNGYSLEYRYNRLSIDIGILFK